MTQEVTQSNVLLMDGSNAQHHLRRTCCHCHASNTSAGVRLTAAATESTVGSSSWLELMPVDTLG